MKTLTFHIVDVFAEEKYAGNQLAVFRNAQGLSDAEMQKLARETNFSETTFILSDTPRDGGYDVRIFTPAAEVPFAGHPTLGTSYVIRQEIIKGSIEQLNLNLKIGKIPVTFGRPGESDVLWMKQRAPEFGATIDANAMADMLGLAPDQIDRRFPPQEVSTGLPFVVVPLTNRDAIRQARVARDKYFAFIGQKQGPGILVFCPEPYGTENDLNVRVFVPYYGIEEDPATGSGNGCLASYLVRHRYFDTDRIDIRVEQGYEIDRPSLIYHRASEQAGRIDVNIGGKVAMIATGQFL